MDIIPSDNETRLTSLGSTPLGRKFITALCVVSFFVVVFASCIRLSLHMNLPEKPATHQYWALCDFRNNIYYPTVSFLSGDNPYDRHEFLARYPVRLRFAPYTPLFLLVHVPFGLLSHTPSQLLYFALTIALTLVYAWLSLWMCGRSSPSVASVTGIAALVLASRPGNWNLMLGQTTFEFVLPVYIALFSRWRSNWLPGLALAGATMKATFGLPLMVLMIVQRQYKAVVIGVCAAILMTLIPTMVLVRSAGNIETLAITFLDSVRVFEDDPAASSVVSTSRIDVVALVGRVRGSPPGPISNLVLFASILSLAAITIRRVRASSRGREADLFCISVASIAILVATYQQVYSALLLVLPLTALVLGCWAPSDFMAGSGIRRVLIVLLSVPFANHLIAQRFLNYLDEGTWGWILLVSINGIAMLLAFGVYVWVAFRRPRVVVARAPQDDSIGPG